MAASDTLLSTGIGLQAQLVAPAQVFAKQQQDAILKAKAAQQKAKEDEEVYQRLMKDISVNPKDYHRLVKGEVASVAANAVNKILELKNSGDPNWRNQVYGVENDFRNQIAHLSGLSEDYKAFEKGFTTLGAYQTKDQQALKVEFDNSKSYLDLAERAKRAGLTSFDPDSGLITNNTFFQRIDVGNELDRDFGKIDPVETSVSTSTIEGKPVQTIKASVPITIAQAQQYSVDGYTPASLESVAISKLQDPAFRFQYADSRDIDINDENALVQSMMREGAEYASSSIKRRNLGSIVEVNMMQGEKASPAGLSKEMTTIQSGIDDVTGKPVEIQSIRNIGVNYDNYSVSNQTNLTDFKGNKVPGGNLSETRVIEVRMMPYEVVKKTENENSYIRPVKKGTEFSATGGKNTIQGLMPFVVFGSPGAYYYLPASNFSFAEIKKGKDALSNTVESTISAMLSNAPLVNKEIMKQRQDPNSALSRAMSSKDTESIYNIFYDIYNKVEAQ